MAAQPILPDIVPAADLHHANGQQFTATARTFVGPPVGAPGYGMLLAARGHT